MVTPEEKAALEEITQLLEAQPEESTSATPLVSLTNDDQIPAQREKLAILVSTGKSKEAIGVQLTHDQVKRLPDKDVQKYSKRYEAYICHKTTESLIDSFIMLYHFLECFKNWRNVQIVVIPQSVTESLHALLLKRLLTVIVFFVS